MAKFYEDVLIINGNEVYELDEACLEEKEEKEKLKENPQ